MDSGELMMAWWWHGDSMMMAWWWHDDGMMVTWWNDVITFDGSELRFSLWLQKQKNICHILMDALRTKHSKSKLKLQSLKSCFGQQCSPFPAVALCPNRAQRKKNSFWLHHQSVCPARETNAGIVLLGIIYRKKLTGSVSETESCRIPYVPQFTPQTRMQRKFKRRMDKAHRISHPETHTHSDRESVRFLLTSWNSQAFLRSHVGSHEGRILFYLKKHGQRASSKIPNTTLFDAVQIVYYTFWHYVEWCRMCNTLADTAVYVEGGVNSEQPTH